MRRAIHWRPLDIERRSLRSMTCGRVQRPSSCGFHDSLLVFGDPSHLALSACVPQGLRGAPHSPALRGGLIEAFGAEVDHRADAMHSPALRGGLIEARTLKRPSSPPSPHSPALRGGLIEAPGPRRPPSRRAGIPPLCAGASLKHSGNVRYSCARQGIPPLCAGASLKPVGGNLVDDGPQHSPALRGGLIEAGRGSRNGNPRACAFPRSARGPH